MDPKNREQAKEIDAVLNCVFVLDLDHAAERVCHLVVLGRGYHLFSSISANIIRAHSTRLLLDKPQPNQAHP